MSLEDDLPENWEVLHADDDILLTGEFRHVYLDIRISVNRFDADEFGFDVESEYCFSFFVRWAGDFGMIEDDFEPEEYITSRADAQNWLLALLTQVDLQFTPANNRHMDRAMAAAVGGDPGEGRSKSFPDHPTCPVCDSPFFQFRGFDTREQAQNHFDYMDDEKHEGWEISIEDKSA